MARYIDADKLVAWCMETFQVQSTVAGKALVDAFLTAVLSCQTADVVPKSEVAELLRLMFNDDCACNYNGNDEWLPFKCKYALTDCPMPKERLGCWMEFVEYGLAELKKKYQGGEPNGD